MNIIKYPKLKNTNLLLHELSKKDAKPWTVVWTANQTEGRGYAGNSWVQEPEKNIAVSLLIESDITYNELYFFNQWISVGVLHVLKKYADETFVKWPNDLIIKDKKVCGILIETRKTGNKMKIIVGIGLNVNQKNYDSYPKGGSLLTQTGREFNLDEILTEILTEFEQSFYKIEEKQWKEISAAYNNHLYKKDKKSLFKINQEEKRGTITGVDSSGRLEVKFEEEGIKKFNHKEIELLY